MLGIFHIVLVVALAFRIIGIYHHAHEWEVIGESGDMMGVTHHMRCSICEEMAYINA